LSAAKLRTCRKSKVWPDVSHPPLNSSLRGMLTRWRIQGLLRVQLLITPILALHKSIRINSRRNSQDSQDLVTVRDNFRRWLLLLPLRMEVLLILPQMATRAARRPLPFSIPLVLGFIRERGSNRLLISREFFLCLIILTNACQKPAIHTWRNGSAYARQQLATNRHVHPESNRQLISFRIPPNRPGRSNRDLVRPARPLRPHRRPFPVSNSPHPIFLPFPTNTFSLASASPSSTSAPPTTPPAPHRTSRPPTRPAPRSTWARRPSSRLVFPNPLPSTRRRSFLVWWRVRI
jgi:hypothetical protein